jgi:hypothetical protein
MRGLVSAHLVSTSYYINFGKQLSANRSTGDLWKILRNIREFKVETNRIKLQHVFASGAGDRCLACRIYSTQLVRVTDWFFYYIEPRRTCT